jgi:hypothetical protein
MARTEDIMPAPNPSNGEATTAQAALEALAAALDPGEFVTSLTSGYGRRPFLTVTSRHAAIGDNIYTDTLTYWWSWAERIAPATDPRAAAAEISRVLGTSAGPSHG